MSCLLLALSASAQSDRGTITGTVMDQANAMVPNAVVVATSSDTGAQYQTTSTATGNYTLASIPAGVYNLTVEVPGFKKFTQQGIRVSVAQTLRVDVGLQIGAATESITVQAEASMLKTESAEQSHAMTGEQIGNLPINFSVLSGGYVRSPFAFITLEPGANNTGQNSIRVNGMPNGSESMYMEGQEATNSLSNNRIDELQPSVEAIEAATLQTSNFAPEFGQIVGGQFNFNAKSGTNQFHGSLYEYLANDALNAGIPFTDSGAGHLIRPAVRKNDFGFSVGGPAYIPKIYNGRNRTFFFLSWEFYKEHRQTTGIYQTVPTAAMRNGDFSQILGRNLGNDPIGRAIIENSVYDPGTARSQGGTVVTDPFPGNRIPAEDISPVAAKIQAFIPQPTNAGLVNNWNQTYPAPKFQSVPSIKLDQYLGSAQKVSFYFSRFRTDQYVTPDGLPVPITALRILYERNNTMRLNYDYTVSPRVLVHAGVGYIMYRNPDTALDGVLNYDAPGQLGLLGGIPYNFTGSATATGFPRITGLNTATYGLGINMGPANANKYSVDKPTAVLNVSYVRGSHSFKVGGDWRIDAYRDRNVRGSQGIWNFSNAETGIPGLQAASVSGGALGAAYASFLLGLADSASVQTPQDPQFRKMSFSMFIQDDWKVTRKLTINYGVRWDHQGAADEIHQRIAEFSPTTPNPAVGGLLGATIYEGNGDGRCNCSFTNTYPYAIGPRLGVAYQITPKTVFRGGWGITYGTTDSFGYISNVPILGGGSIGYNQISFVSPAFGTPAATFAAGLPYTQAQLYPATLSAGIVPFTGQLNSPPYWIDPNAGRPPRINQWNIGIQRELTKNLVLSAAYVGNRGVWLQANNLIDINGLSQQRLQAFGLNINDPTARSLLTSTFASGKPQAAGFQLPYASFPVNQTLAQALRPFPQFTNIPARWAPLGNDWYDALQATATQRLSHGLEAQVSFTWQKELTTAENTNVNDVFNPALQKAISGSSIPFVTAISFSYEIPGVSGSRVLRAVTGNWRLGGTLRYQSGLPILSPYATNNLGSLMPRSVGANMTFANPTGQSFFTQDPNCHCFDPNTTFILNPAAWSQPAAGQFGTAAPYYNNYRWQRQPSEALSLGRTFKIGEGKSFMVRAEFFNVFNRVVLSMPTANNAAATQNFNKTTGQTISGFGYINTSVTNIQTGGAVPTSRNGQIVARFQW